VSKKANPYRGEVEVPINGDQYIITMSFDLISRIESTLPNGVMEFARRCQAMAFRHSEIVSVILLAICDADPELTAKKARELIGKEISANGIVPLMRACLNMITIAINGVPKKEAEPEEEDEGNARANPSMS